MSDRTIQDAYAGVIRREAEAIEALGRFDVAEVERAAALILGAGGRLIATGMGKSGHIARKIAATFASTGTPAQYVHPGEASHGDLGMIRSEDVIVALSRSGETAEMADILTYARRYRIPVIAITGEGESSLARHAQAVLLLPRVPEACAVQMAPTTSTTASLVIGDALAVAVMTARGFAREEFLNFHPGGKLGAQLATVGDLMRVGSELPVVEPGTPMSEAILVMTQKGFGIAAMVEDGRLIGVVTDGDLRRNLEGLMDKSAGEVASRDPRTIGAGRLASDALATMNEAKITTLCVTGEGGDLVGLVRMHDCLKVGVA